MNLIKSLKNCAYYIFCCPCIGIIACCNYVKNRNNNEGQKKYKETVQVTVGEKIEDESRRTSPSVDQPRLNMVASPTQEMIASPLQNLIASPTQTPVIVHEPPLGNRQMTSSASTEGIASVIISVSSSVNLPSPLQQQLQQQQEAEQQIVEEDQELPGVLFIAPPAPQLNPLPQNQSVSVSSFTLKSPTPPEEVPRRFSKSH